MSALELGHRTEALTANRALSDVYPLIAPLHRPRGSSPRGGMIKRSGGGSEVAVRDAVNVTQGTRDYLSFYRFPP